MKRTVLIVSLVGAICCGLALRLPVAVDVAELLSLPVAEVLTGLGDAPMPHQPDLSLRGASAEAGKELVLLGRTNAPGFGFGRRISQHFVCTSCHNVERDEPYLSRTDPLARLRYVAEKGLPYLQGSSLYGIVNRSSFYNGDYKKKYGALVDKARNNLREAIQLCATECSQGRHLQDWEMESVLAYLWTIGLKMEDLSLSEEELHAIAAAKEENQGQAEAIQLIKSKYLHGMPATFVEPPSDRNKKTPTSGDAENGRLLYELSCLHCHRDRRYAFFLLDDSQLSLQYLDRHFSRYSRYSVYEAARYGTSPLPWKRAYMPQYTLEKLSEEMLEDLRTYLHRRNG